MRVQWGHPDRRNTHEETRGGNASCGNASQSSWKKFCIDVHGVTEQFCSVLVCTVLLIVGTIRRPDLISEGDLSSSKTHIQRREGRKGRFQRPAVFRSFCWFTRLLFRPPNFVGSMLLQIGIVNAIPVLFLLNGKTGCFCCQFHP